MAKTENPMKGLYRKLASFGLPKAWVQKNLLPSWWDDEAALSNAGFAEALLHVSRTAGLDLASLRENVETVKPVALPVRYKHRAGVDEQELEVARAVACQLARTVSVASPATALPATSPLELRELLLASRNWIDLNALVAHCWSIGIPVLLTTNLPSKVKRPDALAVDTGGKKVIVLTTGRTSAPWLLFYVAHELGHIALGHVDLDSVLLDSTVSRDDTDEQEVAANNWAVALLTGNPDTRFRATSNWPNASELAHEAQRLARSQQTDPGVIVLNYAYSMGGSFYGVANAALKLLPGVGGGDELIHKMARASLDWSRLGEDAAEFAARMLETAEENTAPAQAS